MIGYIAGGCIAIYIVAFLLRWLVKLYTKVSGREIASYKVRYTTIGVATIIAFLLSVFGEGGFNSPDYSHWWVFLISGLIVFAGSLGYSYKKWKEGQQGGEERDDNNPDSSPTRPLNDRTWDEDSEGGCLRWVGLAPIVGIIIYYASQENEVVAMSVGLILKTVMWSVGGFVTAITNPYYLGGLVIGIGTGWILRGAFD